MRVEEICELQKILCRTGDQDLGEVLRRNVEEYVRERQNCEPLALFAAARDTRGFVMCCLDSLHLLTGTLPTPPDFVLSVSNQNTLTQVIQLLVGFGVAALCDPGVCPVSTPQVVERYEVSPVQCNIGLQEMLMVLQPLANDNFYSSLVLSKYLGILIAAAVQILYGPNNPARIIKQNKDNVAVEKSKELQTAAIKSFLDDLLYKSHNVVSELVSLQLPKGRVKPPRWLLAVTNDLMRNQVIRPNGVINVTRALFEHYGNVLAYEDQVFCDKISTVIITPPRLNPDIYTCNITEQVSSMLEGLANTTLKKQYLRLYKNMVHKLSADYPEQTFQTVWCKLFRPCQIWNENEDYESDTVVSETELERHVRGLETVANLGLFQGCLSDRLSRTFLLPLLYLYHHLYQSISHLKGTVVAVIKELMTSSTVWSDVIMDFLAGNLSEQRNVSWEHGDTGGVVLKCFRASQPSRISMSFDPEDILGGTDKIVEVVIKLLKLLPSGTNQLSDFFIKLFRDLILSVNEPEDKENFLDGPSELYHFQASLRKGMLLDQLCQTFGQKLLKNTTQTIELLKIIVLQKSENTNFEKDELLLISFGILSTYLRDEIVLSEGDEGEIKSLMGPLEKIVEYSGNKEVANMANDLRICIATKINIESLNCFAKDNDSDQNATSLTDIIRDLRDPLIPSRAHAIIQLGKKFAEKDGLVVEHVELLQKIILDNLTHDDSYIFLAAVKCLAQISWHDTQTVLNVVTREIGNSGRKEEDRTKCMEVLVNIIKITNEMLPRYETQIFNCLLSCVTSQDSELLRASSLSCLGQLCGYCKQATISHIQEIISVCEMTVLEDQSELAKKAAILLLSNIVQSQDRNIFYQLERETLRIYRLLKKVSLTNANEEIQTRSLQSLGVLSNIVRQFMFPKTQIKHDIKIL